MVSASWIHGGLDCNLLAPHGGWWIPQGGKPKSIRKPYFSVGASNPTRNPIPPRWGLMKSGEITPETLKILGEINNSTGLWGRQGSLSRKWKVESGK